MDVTALIIAFVALFLGGLIGWLLAGRQAGALKAERDGLSERFRAAVTDLAAEAEARKAADLQLSALLAEQRARDEAHDAQIAQLKEAQGALTAQFREVGQAMLGEAQKAFLERADQRFKQSEETAGQNLKALLSPVHDRLQKYEEAVGKVEAERQNAFGLLHGQIAAMREGTERVSSEAAKLVNALRNAPKARGRWGEQQLRNVLESCGLSEHADFQTEVSVADGDGGRLRPDVVVKVPGGQSLVIDAKVSLNAYQDAFGAVDEGEKAAHLAAACRGDEGAREHARRQILLEPVRRHPRLRRDVRPRRAFPRRRARSGPRALGLCVRTQGAARDAAKLPRRCARSR
jgi:DNA recombination protein RmuC